MATTLMTLITVFVVAEFATLVSGAIRAGIARRRAANATPLVNTLEPPAPYVEPRPAATPDDRPSVSEMVSVPSEQTTIIEVVLSAEFAGDVEVTR